MFSLVLTFVACLGTSSCKDVVLPFDGTPHQCMLFGQQAIAVWVGEHPGYRVPRGYRCTTEDERPA